MERAYRIWKSSHLISSILKAYELVSVITQDNVVEEATDDRSSEVLGLKVVDTFRKVFYKLIEFRERRHCLCS